MKRLTVSAACLTLTIWLTSAAYADVLASYTVYDVPWSSYEQVPVL